MTTATANAIRIAAAAAAAFEAHFIPCRTCGTAGRLCAVGTRLHTAYADAQKRINR